MKSNSNWRARVAQTLLLISTLSADCKSSALRCWLSEILTSALRLASLFVLATLASSPSFAQNENNGYPEDWTHHHVVFSDPGTLHEASGRGSFDTWYKIVTDPRFAHQRHRHREDPDRDRDKDKRGSGSQTPPPLDRDWSATLGGAGVAPDMFPAKWTFSVSGAAASCSDYVVFPVNKAGVSGSQPNIVGYQNLYVHVAPAGVCAGAAPTVLFSYFVGTGTVQTSPVLGPSANQVAYVESIVGGSKFHVLKGAGTGASNGTIAIPVAPGTGNTAADVALTLNGAVSVTRSSPFYDYANDVAYVGDDSGKLHKVTPVFNAAPAEVTTGGWPATVSIQASKILTGPVRDSITGRIFVGDSQGFLYSVSTTGVVTTSGQLGIGTGIVESPMVDSTASSVYVFVGDNAGGTASAVYVFNISSGDITGGSTGSNVTVGTNSATIPVYGGDFDNNYFTSANGLQPAGNLYVCGNAGGNPTLYEIPITYSGGPVLGTVATGPVLASSNVACSPLTEFYNTSGTPVDWLFGGVPGTSCGAGTGAGGCVMSFNITSGTIPAIGPWTPSTAYTSTSQVVDIKGQVQQCTGGGCLIAGATSGTTTPVWTTGAGTTLDGATTTASSVGTVSADSAVAGATVTIGAVTLTASMPTAATGTVTVIIVPPFSNTTGIAGTTYTWHTTVAFCGATANCIITGGTAAQDAQNIAVAVNGSGTCGFTNGGVCVVNGTTNPNATATVAGAVVTLTARIPGTGGNALVLNTSDTASMHLNGTTTSPTTFGVGTGTAGTDGSNVAPNFRWTGAAGLLTTAQLAANIVAAITPAEETTAGITGPTYTAGTSSFTITAAATGAAGNSITVGGTLAGFAWAPTGGHLAGGNNQLIWTYQSASNGQATAAEATGTSGIVIDNVGAGVGEASIYFGTLSGTGAANSAVKMTQAGLQ
jgi:hypothetical protein